ncbi:tyrosine-type recombinase/integrase [Cohnella sp. CFH 77786]|uniref:tyrosine-type recombinase/integrase n=1 Tax=Cohnella sp. CFH 77786 TaxID=2662265 RepID=UPI001C60A1E1|nr:site-specific integrase [Cohnella sp. CFH 77786]MBW5448641.1 tyrosine-type recombinase/integrase [Cohnella sp. CFH 77786]
MPEQNVLNRKKKKRARRSKGEGSIFQRKSDGMWVAKVPVGFKPDGTVINKLLYSKDEKLIKVKVDQLKREVLTNIYIEPNNLSVADWFEIWLKITKNNSIKKTTKILYESLIRNHILPILGGYKLSKLRRLHLQKFINDKLESGRLDGKGGGLSAKTVKHLCQIINSALKEAAEQKFISDYVTLKVAYPKQKRKRIKVLMKEQVEAFLCFIRNHPRFQKYYAPILLEIYTGVRRGELLGLRWDNVSFSSGMIKLEQQLVKVGSKHEISDLKTDSSHNRIIAIPEEVVAVLEEYRQRKENEYKLLGYSERKVEVMLSEGLVFTNTVGNPIQPRNFIRDFKQMLKAADVPSISFHSLRHFFAVWSIDNGVNIKTLQSELGHSDSKTTLDTYGDHINDEMKKEAAKKRRLIVQKGIEQKNEDIILS